MWPSDLRRTAKWSTLAPVSAGARGKNSASPSSPGLFQAVGPRYTASPVLQDEPPIQWWRQGELSRWGREDEPGRPSSSLAFFRESDDFSDIAGFTSGFADQRLLIFTLPRRGRTTDSQHPCRYRVD